MSSQQNIKKQLLCHLISVGLSLSHQDWNIIKRGGDKHKFENERLQQFPSFSYSNHSNPFPVSVPQCVDKAKRGDASYCMTNWMNWSS